MTEQEKIPDRGRAPAAEAMEAEPGTPHETPEPQPTGEPGTIRETRETRDPGETGETGSATDTEVDARLEELHDRWLRAVAELDNLRKRTARDIARQRLDERARVAAEWLPVIDNLELALRHADDDTDPGAVIEGVRAVRDQAVAVLARLGFPRVEDLGTRFDPARHEAVSTAEDPEAEPGTVVAVVRPGYGDGPDQLRPASVVVSTKAED
ncbi:nucleotide exchange factor GrpE [Planotetraspora phitsanulokensis]|uniref:Protein GrpE n=1 Tax=Planotetraspora phitsanulokensis TaxID=575192 RepID=A0A8J3XJD3_9ACTN|nr:nucleotide exchange factor GrpE [Planotetraspora phitsanulokensis]GII41886.1 protein GrpE [Planotetraspora phitsanulokensis]